MSKLTNSRAGDLAEFYAVTWLWDQGYEVFLNPGSSGVIDMIAWKDGEVKLIDVKSKSIRKTDTYQNKAGDVINRTPTQKQKAMGVEIYIHDETK